MDFIIKDDNDKEITVGSRVYCGSTGVRKPEDFGTVSRIIEPDEMQMPKVVVEFDNPDGTRDGALEIEDFPTHLPGPWHDYVCYDVEVQQ